MPSAETSKGCEQVGVEGAFPYRVVRHGERKDGISLIETDPF